MSERTRMRLFLMHVLVLSLVLTLFGRLWYMQVLAGDQYAKAAQHTHTRQVVTDAPRGQILDDFGRPLATNRAMLVVSVDRAALDKQKDKGVGVIHRLAAALHQPFKTLWQEVQYCYETHTKPCWNGPPYQPIPVVALDAGVDANTRTALMIEERQSEFVGVTAELDGVRDYPQGATAGHLIGYLQPITADELKDPAYKGYQPLDKVGRAGVEKSYESELRGTDGTKTLGVDLQGHISGVVSEQPPVPGDNVVMSVDTGVQKVLQQALAHAIARAPTADPKNPVHPTNAAGVVVDVRTGHIVAMASYPSYDINVWNKSMTQAEYDALQKNNRLLDLAVQGEYAPGSTFKLISTSAVIKEGLATWDGRYACPSYVMFGQSKKRNSESESFPPLTLHDALKVSCDTVYYNFAKAEYARDYNLVVKQHKKPVEEVVKMAKAYGLGSQTGVDLPSESTGMIIGWAGKKQLGEYYHTQFCRGANGWTDSHGVKHPPQKNPARRAEDKKRCSHPDPGDTLFLPGDQANMNIGQGTVLTTPLQMAMAYAALVNGGTVYSPRVVKAVVSPDGTKVQPVNAPVRGHLPVSKDTLAQIKSAMYAVTQQPKGTGYDVFKGFPFDKVAVGGKTGTAQVAGHADTSVFASFAGRPGKEPQYAAIIMVPDAGFGASVAAPAMREVWEGIYGVDGRTAALPGGNLPRALPHFTADGNVTTKAPPGSRLLPSPKPSASGSPAPSPTSSALGAEPPADRPRSVGWLAWLARGGAA